MVGSSASHSLKIRGQIRERDVVVLIDSGDSHNFIATALVKELGLPIASTKDFRVVLGTGLKLGLQGYVGKLVHILWD